jgi:phosphoglycerol transferase MdoB-like AlkP superfamily enzyme
MEWKELGDTVLITGDHRINKDGSHSGITPEQRAVPLFMDPPNGQGKGDTDETVSQLQLAPTILNLLGLPIPEEMQHPLLI